MMTAAAKAKPKEQRITMLDPANGEGKLKRIGGSQSDEWNHVLATQAMRTLWTKHSDDSAKDQQYQAVFAAMIGIAPRDEIEGMLAAQLVAAHNASMEAHRRAMLDEQTFEGRKEALNQANKLSRTYTTLLEALNRHRGKGQQRVTVEHVHVHAGGQAIVGAVEGGGVAAGNQRRPHAQGISHAPVAPVLRADQARQLVPVTGDGGEDTVQDARG